MIPETPRSGGGGRLRFLATATTVPVDRPHLAVSSSALFSGVASFSKNTDRVTGRLNLLSSRCPGNLGSLLSLELLRSAALSLVVRLKYAVLGFIFGYDVDS